MIWNKLILIGLVIGIRVNLIPVHAQIGTDHIRTVGTLPEFNIIVDQEYTGIPYRPGIQIPPGRERDRTEAFFTLTFAPNGPGLQFTGGLLDDGVSVFIVNKGDVFSEDKIQTGAFRELVYNGSNAIVSEAEMVKLSELNYLGFRTPSKDFISFTGHKGPRGIGWAQFKVEGTSIQIIDHAMNYGGRSIVVGEGGIGQPDEEEKIPVSRFEEPKSLAHFNGFFSDWNSGDFDFDGDLDLLIPDEDGNFQLWVQNELHTFDRIEAEGITTIGNPDAVGDVDGDGDLDVWISRNALLWDDPKSFLWLNKGDGTFVVDDQIFPASQPTYFSDLDNDGDLDVLATISIDDFKSEFQTWLNDGSGKFSMFSTLAGVCGPFGIPAELGDLNGDGYADLFYICEGSARVAFNQGNGSFVDSGESYVNSNILRILPGKKLALGDMDGDGDLDAIVPNQDFPSALWLNDGNGVFQLGRTLLDKQSKYAYVADMDTDGDLDILLHTTQLTIYWNEGPDVFTKGESLTGLDINSPQQLVDVDGDGDLDLIAKNGKNLNLYRNAIEYVTPPPTEGGLIFRDVTLRRAVYEALGKDLTDVLTEEDLLHLKVLNLGRVVRGSGAPMILDFSGLEKAVNLESLDVSGLNATVFGNDIPSFQTNDLSFLNSLKKLKRLALDGNLLTQLSLPNGMSHLEVLRVSDNSLTEFEIPSGLTHLKHLYVSRNQLRQISLPEDMVALEFFWADFNQLESLEFPETFTQLRRLSLNHNGLTHLVLPTHASILQSLSLVGNHFANEIRFPQDSSKIFFLYLGNSLEKIGEYGFLSDLKGLEWLQVTDDQFDLTIIPAPLSNLTRLELNLPTRSQFEIPTGHFYLKELFLIATHLDSFVLPTDLHRLEQINLGTESMRQVQFPPGLSALKSFSFYGGRLNHVALSKDMIHLTNLDLSQNQIKRIVIPDGVGSRAEITPTINLFENPVQSVTAPANWNIQSNRAFLRADRISLDSSGNLQLLVEASFGTVIVEKSTDLKNWNEVGRIQITNPGGTHRFRESNASEDRNGFYRVRLQQ